LKSEEKETQCFHLILIQVDPPGLSLTSETIDENRRENDENLRPTPDDLKSTIPSAVSNKKRFFYRNIEIIN
jgi:hypothetical protein